MLTSAACSGTRPRECMSGNGSLQAPTGCSTATTWGQYSTVQYSTAQYSTVQYSTWGQNPELIISSVWCFVLIISPCFPHLFVCNCTLLWVADINLNSKFDAKTMAMARINLHQLWRNVEYLQWDPYTQQLRSQHLAISLWRSPFYWLVIEQKLLFLIVVWILANIHGTE